MAQQNILSRLIEADFQAQLTNDQKNCVLKWDLFFGSDSERKCFVLSGYAGTGKTSLLGSLVRSLKELKWKSVLMAPTGRAAKVSSIASGKSASTIHKKIYRQQLHTDGGMRLALMPNLHTNTVFIVDEASMIGDFTRTATGDIAQRNLLEDLFEYVFSGKNCHLMLVGDEGQLPPVGADFSPALWLEYLRNHFFSVEYFSHQLREVVRQKDTSGILFNATKIRNLENDAHPKINHNFPDIHLITGTELQEHLEYCYDQFGRNETLVVCRSNKNANLYNQHIRGRILWFEEEISTGDLMMVVRNNYFWLDENSEAGFLANGELFEVVRIHRHLDLYGFRFAELTIKLLDYQSVEEVQLLVNLDSLAVEAPNLPRTKLRELFFEIEKDYLDEKNKKKRYDQILSNPYFNAIQAKHAYAVTCHKAQGGQWDAVFVDLGYLPEGPKNRDFHRWLYTSVTRAKKRLYFVNLSEDFIED